jgi:hypothetical protein
MTESIEQIIGLGGFNFDFNIKPGQGIEDAFADRFIESGPINPYENHKGIRNEYSSDLKQRLNLINKEYNINAGLAIFDVRSGPILSEHSPNELHELSTEEVRVIASSALDHRSLELPYAIVTSKTKNVAVYYFEVKNEHVRGGRIVASIIAPLKTKKIDIDDAKTLLESMVIPYSEELENYF